MAIFKKSLFTYLLTVLFVALSLFNTCKPMEQEDLRLEDEQYENESYILESEPFAQQLESPEEGKEETEGEEEEEEMFEITSMYKETKEEEEETEGEEEGEIETLAERVFTEKDAKNEVIKLKQELEDLKKQDYPKIDTYQNIKQKIIMLDKNIYDNKLENKRFSPSGFTYDYEMTILYELLDKVTPTKVKIDENLEAIEKRINLAKSMDEKSGVDAESKQLNEKRIERTLQTAKKIIWQIKYPLIKKMRKQGGTTEEINQILNKLKKFKGEIANIEGEEETEDEENEKLREIIENYKGRMEEMAKEIEKKDEEIERLKGRLMMYELPGGIRIK